MRSSGVVGATSGTSASPRASHTATRVRRLFEREVRNDQAARPDRDEHIGEPLEPPGEDRVGVAHDDHRNALGELPADLEHVIDRHPVTQRRGGRGMDDRAVGQRI